MSNKLCRTLCSNCTYSFNDGNRCYVILSIQEEVTVMRQFLNKMFSLIRIYRMKYFLCWFLVMVLKRIKQKKELFEQIDKKFNANSCSPEIICPNILEHLKMKPEENCRYYYEYELCAIKIRPSCTGAYTEEYVKHKCAEKSIHNKSHALTYCMSSYTTLPLLILPLLV
ncbi:uncharacterized protein LOC128249877 isoform X2 [Octopus bimaculoides]|uniref:uncharacterized protein LOC128249877 isoform X2 n=1 Tax=Octopus bimaculoides TaxID=37653 RepID=UPI0022E050D6|nr:uncharacterized protein LOC128249877 isoform X2 [Octopus bimaculoides]